MKFKEWYKKNTAFFYLSILSITIGVIGVGCVLIPSLFYDQWIWKYYWGPVVADAAGHPVSWNNIQAKEGYTLVSEITYGIILIIALYGIHRLLKKLKTHVDWRFCLALMPYIIFGPVTRTLEDAGYFKEPFVYWFISPLIYFQIAAYAIFFLITGHFLEKLSGKHVSKTILVYALLILITVDICYTIIWLLNIKYGTYILHPLVFYLLSLIAFLPLFYMSITKEPSVNTVVFSGGLLILLPSLYITGRWISGFPWEASRGVRFDVFLLITTITAIIITLVYLISRRYNKNEKITVYKNPLNLSIIAGHMIDGLTSYVSIYDPLNMGIPQYLEKHPASDILMDVWPPLFPIVKFTLIIFVIYIFDILYKDELKNHLSLVNLIKIGVLILGLSPGLRDLLRVTMGV